MKIIGMAIGIVIIVAIMGLWGLLMAKTIFENTEKEKNEQVTAINEKIQTRRKAT